MFYVNHLCGGTETSIYENLSRGNTFTETRCVHEITRCMNDATKMSAHLVAIAFNSQAGTSTTYRQYYWKYEIICTNI